MQFVEDALNLPKTTIRETANDPYVEAVFDLITMTNQGKLQWARFGDPAFSSDCFTAHLGDKRLVLEDDGFAHITEGNATASILQRLARFVDEPRMKRRNNPYLRVYRDNQARIEELVSSFPDVPPLSSLLMVVQSQLLKNDEILLEEIHKAATANEVT